MSDHIHIGTRKGLFTVKKTNGTWKITDAAFIGDQVPMVFHDPRDKMLYAAINLGHFGSKLHRSQDDGQTWTEIAVPVYPAKPDDFADIINPMNNRPVPWSLELIWALEAGAEEGELWCGTIPGGLFHSKDRGDSWRFIEDLWVHERRRKWFGGGFDNAGIHSIAVDPRDQKRITFGVSCGGVLLSTDNGETWNTQCKGMRAEYMPPDQAFDPDVQDPHRLVQCPGEPDKFWVQHHNGIFRSTDNAAIWTEIQGVKPSAFGFAVVVHPTDGDTAWFVPAVKDEKRVPVDGKLVVTRTRDGGKSFELLSAGLPQEHAYDIAFRHAMDIHANGDTIAFGTTTGSVFISDNQGDSWKTLSTHLPPVYVTRFVK